MFISITGAEMDGGRSRVQCLNRGNCLPTICLEYCRHLERVDKFWWNTGYCVTYICSNTVLAETDLSTPAIPKSAIEHDSEPVLKHLLSSQHFFLKPILKFPSRLLLDLSIWRFPTCFPTKVLYVFHVSSLLAGCQAWRCPPWIKLVTRSAPKLPGKFDFWSNITSILREAQIEIYQFF
jgi:hypothetical protein